MANCSHRYRIKVHKAGSSQNISMSSRPGKTVASAEHARLRQLTETLRHNLEACAKDATVDSVHDTRTGTRRIEAMLDSLVRERSAGGPESDSEKAAALYDAAQRWLKLLKKNPAGRGRGAGP